jgi:RNA-directed DNA polymerase
MGDGLTRYRDNVRILALAILGGSWEKEALTDRLEQSLDGGPPDPARLASRLMFHFDTGMPPGRQRLIEFLHNEDELHRHLERLSDKQRPNILLDPTVMGTPPDNLLTFPLPPLPTVKELYEWLGVFRHELDWFADIERRQCRVAHSKLHHYSYRWIEKRCGSPRLIEIPKTRLKRIQHRIAREILNHAPPRLCSRFYAGPLLQELCRTPFGKTGRTTYGSVRISFTGYR